MYLLIIWFVLFLAAYRINHDIFSPTKFLLVGILIPFFDIFVSPYSIEIQLVYAGLLLIMATVLVFEKRITRFNGRTRSLGRGVANVGFTGLLRARVHLFFWVLGLPLLIAQIAMVEYVGGIETYAQIVKLRVVELSGFGPVTFLIRTYLPLNLVYFAVLFSSFKRIYLRDYVVYAASFGGVVIIGMLSGSRGYTLANIVLMLLFWNYAVRPVPKVLAIVIAFLLVSTAAILGVIREAITFHDGAASIESATVGYYSLEFTGSALRSIEMLLGNEHYTPYLGSTYVAAVTNLIPRFIWPGKPSSGGVVFTRDFFGYESSNFSTGLIGEALLNFGILGLAVAYSLLLLISYLLNVRYLRMARLVASDRRTVAPLSPLRIVRYIVILWAGFGLISGEFAGTIAGLIIMLVQIFLIQILITHFLVRTKVGAGTQRLSQPSRHASTKVLTIGAGVGLVGVSKDTAAEGRNKIAPFGPHNGTT